MYLVDFKRCSFKKGDETVEYYRCVFASLEGDYKVKGMTKECYDGIRRAYDERCELFVPVSVRRVFYDEWGRVCDIEF